MPEPKTQSDVPVLTPEVLEEIEREVAQNRKVMDRKIREMWRIPREQLKSYTK